MTMWGPNMESDKPKGNWVCTSDVKKSDPGVRIDKAEGVKGDTSIGTIQHLVEAARGKIKFLEEQLGSKYLREYGHNFRPPNWRRKATRALNRERERLAMLAEAMKGLIHKKKEPQCQT